MTTTAQQPVTAAAPDAPAVSAASAPAPAAPRSAPLSRIGRLFRRVSRRMHSACRAVAARNRFAARLYYAFISHRFDREHQAVLAGCLRFHADQSDPRGTCAFLRRSTHRLEKGLMMRPMRDVFALDYIHETVDCYCRIVADPAKAALFNSDELKWSHDVLSRYFAVTAAHPKIDGARRKFAAAGSPDRAASCDVRFVPYQRDLAAPLSISYEQLLALSQRRRSVRWFLQKPVPRELIEKAVAVATQSPSACNRQPFVFRVFDDPALVPQIAAIPGGTRGFSHNFPAVIVVVGQLRNYYDERDRHVIYIDASLASMSLVYALETLGLSSCCINWPDLDESEQQMKQALGLEPDERPIMLIALGYPDPEGLVAYSQKKSVQQLCRFNHE